MERPEASRLGRGRGRGSGEGSGKVMCGVLEELAEPPELRLVAHVVALSSQEMLS